MQPATDQLKKPVDEVSWWFKLLTRGLGTVGGVGNFYCDICFRDKLSLTADVIRMVCSASFYFSLLKYPLNTMCDFLGSHKLTTLF